MFVATRLAVKADALGETVNGLTSSLTTGLTNGLFSGLRDTLSPDSRAPRARQYGAGANSNDPYNQQGPQMGYPAMNMYGSHMMGGPYGQMGAFGMGPASPQMWHQAMPMPPPPPPFGMPPPPPYGMMNPYQQLNPYQQYQQMQQPMNQNNPYLMNPYQQQQQQQQQRYGQVPNNNPNMMNNYQHQLTPASQSDQQQANNQQLSQQLDDQPMFARPAVNRGRA